MKYRAEIDGLRALAVLSVVLFHANISYFSGGYVGVDVFFVISGFLISSILIKEIEGGHFSLGHFYERRVRRIIPALFTVMFVSVPFAVVILYPSDLISFGESLISIPLFISNFLFWHERGYFGVATELKPMVHTWSLAVEEQFYIVFPLFLILFWSLRKRALLMMVGIFALSLFLSWYVSRLHFETAFYLPFTRAWEFLAGTFASIGRVKITKAAGAVISDVLAAIGLFLIGFAIFSFDSATVFPGLVAMVPVAGTVLVIIGTEKGEVVRKILSFKPFVYVGLISYSLYLWHQPIFVFARYEDVFENHAAILIGLSVVMAVGSYFFVEKPFRNKKFLSRKVLFLCAFGVSLLSILIGGVLVYNRGYENRYALSDQKIMAQFEARETYNQTRFEAIEHNGFADNGKKKVLLVGDSYAKDLLNVLYEGGYAEKLDIAVKQVNSECGNVYVKDESVLDQYIPAKVLGRCHFMGRYKDDRIKSLLAQADEVWLASAWVEWVVPYLPETVENLKKEYGVKIHVFGRKHFGSITQKKMLEIPETKRASYENKVSRRVVLIENQMRDLLPGDVFVSVMDNICGVDWTKTQECRIFNAQGKLISVDGGHLTKIGAEMAAANMHDFFGHEVKARDTNK